MLTFPNSSAMDATAASGGPITVLPQIVTGQPEQIAQHVLDLVKKAEQFLSMYTELSKAADQLGKIWSGAASESALKKITDSLDQLTKIIGVVQKGAELLGISGTLIKTAQEAYRAVVAAVNPTVASLMSNPWTYGAAVALSTGTSASLRAFITSIGALLKALGATDLAQQITQLATVIGEIEKLFHHDTPTAGATTPSAGTTPVTAPQAPSSVASPAGQQAVAGGSGGGIPQQPSFTDYTPPALATGGGSSGATTPVTANGTPLDPSNSWIAVDPSQHGATVPTQPAPVTQPVAQPAPVTGGSGAIGGANEVVIHTNLTTGESTVEAPGGQDFDVDINLDYNGKHFSQHVGYDAAGN
ncbi:WXG100 family type VII secretion target [Amycolatopsis sp. NBC_00438]|uniref:WXG100 family type VII secretion target n=1 Tax=Amycolatopsis sp. NBC_00438 TaxID=2903558 RepID=UPI002E1E4B89